MIKEDIIHILENIIDNKKFSNIELNYYFNLKKYNYSEKAFIKNILITTIKNLIYIDYVIEKFAKNVNKKKIKHLLRISVAQIIFMNSDNKGIVYEANEIAKTVNIHQAKFVNSVLKNIIKNIDQIDKEIEEKNLLNIKYSYPKWLFEKIKLDFSEDFEEVLKSYKKRSYMSVRINKDKITEDFFINLLKEDIVYRVEDVFYLNNVKKLEDLEEDMYFIQDASSYIVAKNLKATKDSIVLDACSSPGGKALAIINLYRPKKLIASDILDHKINILEEVKTKYAYKNMEVQKKDATKTDNFEKEYFDQIILDVPCTGLGVIRKKPEKIYNLKNSDIKAIKKIQKKIFAANIEYLKKGGELIYSTCTITKNENTNNVSYFLEKYKNLKVEEVEIPKGVKYFKDEFGGIYISYENEYLDGFYFIKFKKI